MLGHEFFPAGARDTRILDFDIENRPLSYWMPDRPTAEVTAIASCWVGEPDSMEVLLLSQPCRHHGWECPDMYPFEMDGPTILARFQERYDQADVVTGHYIRKHDLPIINGMRLELGWAPLPPKLTSDTKLDMRKKADVPATQEFLSEALAVADAKVHMTQSDWREANRLTPDGLVKTSLRVMGDVRQHMQLREALMAAGWLGAPRVWRP